MYQKVNLAGVAVATIWKYPQLPLEWGVFAQGKA